MIWQLSQIELDFWETGQVHIANPDDFTILIKAIRNGNKEGYAAVDDFEIVETNSILCQAWEIGKFDKFFGEISRSIQRSDQ